MCLLSLATCFARILSIFKTVKSTIDVQMLQNFSFQQKKYENIKNMCLDIPCCNSLT
jgi:hypothetical protein